MIFRRYIIRGEDENRWMEASPRFTQAGARKALIKMQVMMFASPFHFFILDRKTGKAVE